MEAESASGLPWVFKAMPAYGTRGGTGVGAPAAAIDGEVGADATVCDAAQGSANIEDIASNRTLRFIEVLMSFPLLFFLDGLGFAARDTAIG